MPSRGWFSGPQHTQLARRSPMFGGIVVQLRGNLRQNCVITAQTGVGTLEGVVIDTVYGDVFISTGRRAGERRPAGSLRRRGALRLLLPDCASEAAAVKIASANTMIPKSQFTGAASRSGRLDVKIPHHAEVFTIEDTAVVDGGASKVQKARPDSNRRARRLREDDWAGERSAPRPARNILRFITFLLAASDPALTV